jgi:hypothetical protein
MWINMYVHTYVLTYIHKKCIHTYVNSTYMHTQLTLQRSVPREKLIGTQIVKDLLIPSCRNPEVRCPVHFIKFPTGHHPEPT